VWRSYNPKGGLGNAQYGGDAESPMIVKLLEDACQTDLRAPGFSAHLEA
jgi:3-hydroxyisobutyrate dehydrogenase